MAASTQNCDVQQASDIQPEQEASKRKDHQVDRSDCPDEEEVRSQDTKRPRLSVCASSIDAAAERLRANAEEVRKALLEEDGRISQTSHEEPKQTKSLQEACSGASRKLEVAAAQCRVEKAALITAKANLRAYQAAQERAAQTEQNLGPLVEGFEEVSREVSEACQVTMNAAAAASTKDSVAELVEALSSLAEPGIDSARARLDETTSRLVSITEDYTRVEAACKAAEDRLVALTKVAEEEEMKRKAAKAAEAIDAKTAMVTKEVAVLEEELTALEAVVASSPDPAPAESEEGAQEASGPGTEADGGAPSTATRCFAFLKERLQELQLACEKQATSISSLEARCGPLQPEAAPKEQRVPAPQQVAEAAEGKEIKDAKEPQTVLNMADPAPFVTARAAQRLFVSSEDAPDLAGEYRQAAGGLNGWPAYKASAATIFLFWTPCEGGRWVFGAELSNESQVLARSLQLAWTALPDEIMAVSWTRAPWGERGQRACIAVLRG